MNDSLSTWELYIELRYSLSWNTYLANGLADFWNYKGLLTVVFANRPVRQNKPRSVLASTLKQLDPFRQNIIAND